MNKLPLTRQYTDPATGLPPHTIGDSIRDLIRLAGDNPDREGLSETPGRVVAAYNELFAGYRQDPADLFTVFEPDGYSQMVVLRGVEFCSTCEHHMLPFTGVAHIAYIPRRHVVGISKLARLVEVYARRLQIQERITEQVTTALMQYLQPLGAACVLEAQHSCMACRGVRKQSSTMITSSLKGDFLEAEVRAEFLQLIRGSYAI